MTLTREQFWEVIGEAIERGWISSPTCSTHNGTPLTPEEDDEMAEGFDPCVPVIRVYEEAEVD